MRTACAKEPFYKEYQGKRYCVFHYPDSDKRAAFSKALKKKLDIQDYDFRGIWFPDRVTFHGTIFNERLNFTGATFNAEVRFSLTTFNEKVSFGLATFNAEVDFGNAIFNEGANFQRATFNAEVEFSNVTFNSAIFLRAIFNAKVLFIGTKFDSLNDFGLAIFNADVDFNEATFKGMVRFSYSIFRASVRFAGDRIVGFREKASLSFNFAKFEKPEQISFQTLTLRPHWFVNLDARKFHFANIEWDLRAKRIEEGIRELERQTVPVREPHRILSITCRQLAINAEENHRYEEASRLRYWSMDLRRRETYFMPAFWRLSWWYWLASGYGERVGRAFVALICIWLTFAWLYMQPNSWPNIQLHVGFAHQTQATGAATISPQDKGLLKVSDALTYSAGVMTLQKPEPRPTTSLAKGLVTLETILGPIQIALLALAIRRKFMR